eukprot:TRINITY_DN6250_c0_g1_i1.p1 TRINITY_DN6250_c0_g1~~TRINITY_DN6250_c0_g1_i1.p1  ORF type:complete len:394 (+),score=117.03 TRINITY_DN6250_c0_g1_i1:1-1182(+)
MALSKAVLKEFECLEKAFAKKMPGAKFTVAHLTTMIAQDPHILDGVDPKVIGRFGKRIARSTADVVAAAKKPKKERVDAFVAQMQAITMELRRYRNDPGQLLSYQHFLNGLNIGDDPDPTDIPAVAAFCAAILTAIDNMELAQKYLRLKTGQQFLTCVDAMKAELSVKEIVEQLATAMGKSPRTIANYIAYYKVVQPYPILLFCSSARFSFVYNNAVNIHKFVKNHRDVQELFYLSTPDITINLQPISIPRMDPQHLEDGQAMVEVKEKGPTNKNPDYEEAMADNNRRGKAVFGAAFGDDYADFVDKQSDAEDEEEGQQDQDVDDDEHGDDRHEDDEDGPADGHEGAMDQGQDAPAAAQSSAARPAANRPRPVTQDGSAAAQSSAATAAAFSG